MTTADDCITKPIVVLLLFLTWKSTLPRLSLQQIFIQQFSIQHSTSQPIVMTPSGDDAIQSSLGKSH